MASRIDGNPMSGGGFDPGQLKSLKLYLDAGGSLEDLGLPTTTFDYDKVADRNIDAALWVIGVFWGFVGLLLVVLLCIGLKTYCRMWAKSQRLSTGSEDIVVLVMEKL
ncbi:uncharacterized protein LOC135479566 [Liolophura sinensis]|uniref:uncharacterized protein LOC135479566 n=1 Tax=Liolophura sinensis TaxID=3198878 RepID=UPI00315855AC